MFQEFLNLSTTFVIHSEKFAEATRKYAALKSELSVSKNTNGQGEGKANKLGRTLKRNKQPVMKISDLKLAFSEFYLSLILLQNYQNLNFTGFRKILKKHDKVICLYCLIIAPIDSFKTVDTNYRWSKMENRACRTSTFLHKQGYR